MRPTGITAFCPMTRRRRLVASLPQQWMVEPETPLVVSRVSPAHQMASDAAATELREIPNLCRTGAPRSRDVRRVRLATGLPAGAVQESAENGLSDQAATRRQT